MPNVLDPDFEEKMGLSRPNKQESKLPQIRQGSKRNSPYYNKESVDPLKEIQIGYQSRNVEFIEFKKHNGVKQGMLN